MLSVYDTHAHLDDKKLIDDVDNIIRRAVAAGVDRINNIGCDWGSSLRSVELAEKYPEHIRAAVGVHPEEAEKMAPDCLELLYELSKHDKVIGWGEIGLDYHWQDVPREVQQRVFRAQIEIAQAAGLPIIIHDREAHHDIINILREQHGGVNGGIMHCYSGSWEMAKECMNLGFRISFGGPLTFKNARTPVEVASKVPLDYLLVETDSPYLSPEPFRGKTNEPGRVVNTLNRLAQIRGIDSELMAIQTTQNALELFGPD